ncbi:hypothetical protein SAMN04489710_102305 [Paracidovorax konjaci]|uniref:Uncharacterized protein n=1 Tax=Paracidovorax konjaci TaxID=32040 RepID=A0A1I1SLQ1_9BURK|nr:hypothetical protein SAMN04489710_102305 [Paracidovorax konjaci]
MQWHDSNSAFARTPASIMRPNNNAWKQLIA